MVQHNVRRKRSLSLVIGVVGVLVGVFASTKAMAQARQDNLAWKKKVVASTGSKDLWGLNDGKYGTKADIAGKGWFTIDLGSPQKVGRVYFAFRGRPFGKGRLSSSDDGVTWTEVWKGCGWTEGCSVTFFGEELFIPTVTAQFFKMETEPAPEEVETSYYEFEMYEPDSSSKNLALDKYAVSPANNYHQIALMPNLRATDGSFSTGIWMMFVPQWIVVDLGAPTLINRIRTISTILGPSQDFSYFASDDNKTWKKLFDHQRGVSSQAFTSNVFERVTARYVKGEFHDKSFQGNSADVKEILIYGPGTSTVDLPTLPMNHAPAPAPDGSVNPASAADASVPGISGPDAGASKPPGLSAQDAGVAENVGSPRMEVTPNAMGPSPSGAPGPGAAMARGRGDQGAGREMPPSTNVAATNDSASSGCSVSGLAGSKPAPVAMFLLLTGMLFSGFGPRNRRRLALGAKGLRGLSPSLFVVSALVAVWVAGGCDNGVAKKVPDANGIGGADPATGGAQARDSVADPSGGLGGNGGRREAGGSAGGTTGNGGTGVTGSGGSIGAGGGGPSLGTGGTPARDAGLDVNPGSGKPLMTDASRDSGDAAFRAPPVAVAPDSVCKDKATCTKDCQQCLGNMGFIPCRCFGATGGAIGHQYCNAEFLVHMACKLPAPPAKRDGSTN